MLKIYIEESVFTSPRPMEVSADAPVSQLIPALVDELGLPKTDLFGNRLVYVLRHATGGWLVPEHSSLPAAGIQPDTHLALDSYVADEAPALAAPVRRSAAQTAQSGSFYADQTIADASAFNALGSFAPSTRRAFPSGPLPSAAPRSAKRWTRRSLFMLGGAVLGVAGVGLGYAAFRSLAGNHPGNSPILPQTSASASATSAPTSQAFLPTKASSLLTFTQHQQTVRSVAWAPNGNMLASGANDRLLLTWNLTGQVQVRKDQAAAIHAVAWSPDARQLAVAAANQVNFLNALNGTAAGRAMRVHRSTVIALAWSAQQPQRLVSAGLDKLAVVWNTQTFKPEETFRLHTTGILSASWASDGQTVGTSSEGGVIRVWNATDGRQVHGFLFDGTVAMTTLAFEPNGARLAVGGMDGVLRLWQSGLVCQQEGNGQKQGQCLDMPLRLRAHAGPIRAAAWSPDGRFLASAGDDGMLFIWYPAQSQTPLLKISHTAPVLSLAWSPDGKKLASASGNTVTLWALS